MRGRSADVIGRKQNTGEVVISRKKGKTERMQKLTHEGGGPETEGQANTAIE